MARSTGQVSTPTLLLAGWALLICVGVGKAFVVQAAAGIARVSPVASARQGVSRTDAFQFVNRTRATRPTVTERRAAACGDLLSIPAPTSESLQTNMPDQNLGVVTFADGAQVYLYLPGFTGKAGLQEVRILTIDGENHPLGRDNSSDVTLDARQGDFPSLGNITLEPYQRGAFSAKVMLESGSNAIAVRVRRAIDTGDVSQVATFHLAVR